MSITKLSILTSILLSATVSYAESSCVCELKTVNTECKNYMYYDNNNNGEEDPGESFCSSYYKADKFVPSLLTWDKQYQLHEGFKERSNCVDFLKEAYECKKD